MALHPLPCNIPSLTHRHDGTISASGNRADAITPSFLRHRQHRGSIARTKSRRGEGRSPHEVPSFPGWCGLIPSIGLFHGPHGVVTWLAHSPDNVASVFSHHSLILSSVLFRGSHTVGMRSPRSPDNAASVFPHCHSVARTRSGCGPLVPPTRLFHGPHRVVTMSFQRSSSSASCGNHPDHPIHPSTNPGYSFFSVDFDLNLRLNTVNPVELDENFRNKS
jgi:hypothetical protein